jgi:hypothetical protein
MKDYLEFSDAEKDLIWTIICTQIEDGKSYTADEKGFHVVLMINGHKVNFNHFARDVQKFYQSSIGMREDKAKALLDEAKRFVTTFERIYNENS